MKSDTITVKRYDYRCNYEVGEQVFVSNRFGESVATITEIIRKDHQSCDQALLEFEDQEFQERWKAQRSTPYFAIHAGRQDVTPEWVSLKRTPLLKTQLIGRLKTRREGYGAIVTAAGIAHHTTHHFVYTPAGKIMDDGTTPNAVYFDVILDLLDVSGSATASEFRTAVQERIPLTPADLQVHEKKPFWNVRMHRCLQSLSRKCVIGLFDDGRWRRIQPNTAARAA